MRVTCPHCGERDSREFTYRGAALDRPDGGDWSRAWDDYLHNRDNPAGPTREHWHHGPCGTWIVAERDTATHAFLSTAAAGGDG